MKKVEAYVDELVAEESEIVVGSFLDRIGVPGTYISLLLGNRLIDICLDIEEDGLDESNIVVLDRSAKTMTRYTVKKESTEELSESIINSFCETFETVKEHYQEL